MSLGNFVAAALAVATWLWWSKLPFVTAPQDVRGAVNAMLGMDATMLGFLVSTGALIFAVAQTSMLRNLYRTGHIPRLLAALFIDAAWFLAALCAALVGMLIEPAAPDMLRFLVAINVGALAALLPVAHTMWHLLLNAGPTDGPLEFK